jgi:hypothetical protein
VTSLPKPEKPAPAPRRRIAPKCVDCGHREHEHSAVGGPCDACPLITACRRYRPARSSVLRSPVARKKATPEMPDCVCLHGCKQHAATMEANEDGAFTIKRGLCMLCGCGRYVQQIRPGKPAVARKSAPARTKRKLMPKCKVCAHPYRAHCEIAEQEEGCSRCLACTGYAPAIGIRQKRRTPAAALKLRCDHLWTAIVHARPEMCEVQRFYAHGCEGGPQALHGIPRTFNVTRHLPINGFKGCAGIHLFMTKRPELWSSVLLDAWGEPTFRELWSKARAMEPVDMEATYRALKTEAEQRSIA